MKKNATYLVMEVNSAYTVVLDNEGRFIKTANSGYQTGDIVEKIIPLRYPQDRKKQFTHAVRIAAGIAAGICIGLFGIYEYQYTFLPYGTVLMQINPEVELTLSHSGRVLDLDGTNNDGRALIEGYEYRGKDRYTVADELADRAIEMGFLDNGGQISLLADSKNISWAEDLEQELVSSLNEHLKEYDLTIEVTVGTADSGEAEILEEPQSITITIPSDSQTPSQSQGGDSGYTGSDSDGDSNYDSSSGSSGGDSGYDSNSGSSSDGDSNYDSGSGSSDGDSSYDSGSGSSDGDSNYDSGSGSSDGNSSYGGDD